MTHSQSPSVASLCFSDTTFSVSLCDCEVITLPFSAETLPCLWYGTPEERSYYEVHSDGIHWPNLNEDVSVNQMRQGIYSGYSEDYVARWLKDIQEFRASSQCGKMTFAEWDLRRRGAWGTWLEEDD